MRRPASNRSLWWAVHSWMGLKLSLFMSFILATGTLAVFGGELDWLARPAMRVAPQDAPHASWGTMVDAIQQQAPNGKIHQITLPEHSWFAVEAVITDAQGEDRRVYVNPYTGGVQGISMWPTIKQFLRQVHRHLMLPVDIGIPLVTSLAFVLLASLVTGLVTYKKFWRGFFKTPRHGNLRRFYGDLHRLGGLWSIPFVLIIVLTSVWYLVELWGGHADLPQLSQTAEISTPASLNGDKIDELTRVAQSAFPDLKIRSILFPSEDDGTLVYSGQADTILVRDRANAVFVDPNTAEVRLVSRAESLNVHQRISEMADPLHFGYFGGLLTKILWFAFGVVLTGLSVTGAMIFSLRLHKAGREAQKSDPATILIKEIGVWAYPTTALIVISLALIPLSLVGMVD